MPIKLGSHPPLPYVTSPVCRSPEDAYQQQAVIDGEPALLDILDTAGQVEFTAMKEQYMRCGEGFVICYSICDRRSFEQVAEYRRLLSRVRAADDVPLVIVGCKLDLDSHRKVRAGSGQRQECEDRVWTATGK